MELDPHLMSEEELVKACEEGPFLINGNRDATRLIRLTSQVVVKFGIDVTAEEAATQHYVWTHSNRRVLRVPQVYRFFTDKSRGPHLIRGYIVMEYINGTDLASYMRRATIGELTPTIKLIAKAVAHLSQIPERISQVPGPVEGGMPRGYIWAEDGASTSFDSAAEMENWLNSRLALYPKLALEEPNWIAKLDLKSRKLVMCHTDLAPRNIILLDDGSICFIDWAFAGFYPYIFEIYALRSRSAFEPIFSEILRWLPSLDQEDEEQLELLRRIQFVQARCGNALQL